MAKHPRTILFPVHNLELGDVTKGIITLGRVSFVSATRLRRTRGSFGFRAPVARLLREAPRLLGVVPLSTAPTYAVIQVSGSDLTRVEQEAQREVLEAFWILASSFLCSDPRDSNRMSLAPTQNVTMAESSIVYDAASNDIGAGLRRYPPLLINMADGDWKRINRRYHFFDLQRLLSAPGRIEDEWLRAIRRACVLAGQSYLARTPHEAFLNDMIAIETLLARRGDSLRSTLAERLIALFGWLTKEETSEWERLVNRLYELRCDFVHDGQVLALGPIDLQSADALVKNLLLNVCKNWRHIRRKQDIVDLAARLRAQKVLGLKPKRFGELHFITPGSGRDIPSQTRALFDWPW